MPSPDLTVAVAGLGEAGRTLHLSALKSLPGCRVIAGCDRDETALERGAK